MRPTSPVAGWLSLGPGVDAAWSPDSTKIAVGTGRDTAIYDESGALLKVFAGADTFLWVDHASLLLRNLDEVPVADTDSGGVGAIYLVSLDSGELERIGEHEGDALSNGAGDVAFSSADGQGSFSIWNGESGWSVTHPGYAVAWSSAGNALAVIHLVEQRIGLAGHLEVVSWPSMTRRASDDTYLVSPGAIRFSPAGRYVAFTALAVTRVLDLETQDLRGVGPEGVWDWFGWTSSDELAIGDPRSRSVSSYLASGERIERWDDVGDAVVSTPDGSTLVFYTNDYPDVGPPLTVVSGGATQTVVAAGTAARAPVLAPDGTKLLMYAPAGDHHLVIMREL